MDYDKTKMVVGDVWHIVTLVLLVALVLGIVTWMGLIRCNQLPGWCQVYDPVYLSLTGKKEVLIVYGDDGLGNPELLFAKLRDPRIVGAIPQMTHISRIGQGNLQNYDLVIVEKARTMSTLKLQQFMDYVDAGGKLIWTGDAGTKLAAGDSLLYKDDLDENASHTAFSTWARRDGKNVVRFDSVISVSYLGNYCEVKGGCGKNSPVGKLLPESTGEHQLIYGMAENQQLYVNSDPSDLRDFALTSEPASIGSKRILTLDFGSTLKGKDEQDFGRYFPIIVTSGVGEKVAYYAQPPEQFIGTYWNYDTGKNETGPMNLLIANLYKFYRK